MVGNMDSLQVTDAASAAVATHPRVKLDDIKGAIAFRFDTTARRALSDILHQPADESGYGILPKDVLGQLDILSICILVMKNGFTVIGKSAPASPENFNRELGVQYAYEDAVRQLWPLMGFALRDKLAAGGVT